MDEDGVMGERRHHHPSQRRYSAELRERAVRLIHETATERGQRHGSATRIASQLGIGAKAELINRRGPCRTVDQVELATAEWVDWWNHRRLHEACGHLPPAEREAAYHAGLQAAGGAA